MPRLAPLAGRTFGRLTVLRRAQPPVNVSGLPLWHCRCSCGVERGICGRDLLAGATHSCGCLRRENARALWRTRR